MPALGGGGGGEEALSQDDLKFQDCLNKQNMHAHVTATD